MLDIINSIMRIEDEDSSIRLFTVKWKEINSYS